MHHQEFNLNRSIFNINGSKFSDLDDDGFQEHLLPFSGDIGTYKIKKLLVI